MYCYHQLLSPDEHHVINTFRALGQVTWAKMAKNLPHLWRHS